MLRSRRTTLHASNPCPNKKQRLEAIRRLCTDIYPKYKSASSNYGFIKQVAQENKQLYPWLDTTMVHNGIRRMTKQLESSPTTITDSESNDDSSSNPLTNNDDSSTTLSDDTSSTEQDKAKARGRPHGTTNADKKKQSATIKKATDKVALL